LPHDHWLYPALGNQVGIILLSLQIPFPMGYSQRAVGTNSREQVFRDASSFDLFVPFAQRSVSNEILMI
tara:strand:- start:83 stop:289 length:207 start_codon:yes stop_codon:yes gene_type:complete